MFFYTNEFDEWWWTSHGEIEPFQYIFLFKDKKLADSAFSLKNVTAVGKKNWIKSNGKKIRTKWSIIDFCLVEWIGCFPPSSLYQKVKLFQENAYHIKSN